MPKASFGFACFGFFVMLHLQLRLQLMFMTLPRLTYSYPKACRAVGFRIETSINLAVISDAECEASCEIELERLRRYLSKQRLTGLHMLRKSRIKADVVRIDPCVAWLRYCTKLNEAFMTTLVRLQNRPDLEKLATADHPEERYSCVSNLPTAHGPSRLAVPLVHCDPSTSGTQRSTCYCDARLDLAQVRKKALKKITTEANFCEPHKICERLNGHLDLRQVKWQCQQPVVLDDDVHCGDAVPPCSCSERRSRMDAVSSCPKWSISFPEPTHVRPQRLWPRTSAAEVCPPVGPLQFVSCLDEMNQHDQMPVVFPMQSSAAADQAILDSGTDFHTSSDTDIAMETNTRAINFGKSAGLKRTSSQASLDSLATIDLDELLSNFDSGTVASVLADNLLDFPTSNAESAVVTTASVPDQTLAADSEDDERSIFGELQPILDLDLAIDAQGEQSIGTAKLAPTERGGEQQYCYLPFL